MTCNGVSVFEQNERYYGRNVCARRHKSAVSAGKFSHIAVYDVQAGGHNYVYADSYDNCLKIIIDDFKLCQNGNYKNHNDSRYRHNEFSLTVRKFVQYHIHLCFSSALFFVQLDFCRFCNSKKSGRLERKDY